MQITLLLAMASATMAAALPNPRYTHHIEHLPRDANHNHHLVTDWYPRYVEDRDAEPKRPLVNHLHNRDADPKRPLVNHLHNRNADANHNHHLVTDWHPRDVEDFGERNSDSEPNTAPVVVDRALQDRSTKCAQASVPGGTSPESVDGTGGLCVAFLHDAKAVIGGWQGPNCACGFYSDSTCSPDKEIATYTGQPRDLVSGVMSYQCTLA